MAKERTEGIFEALGEGLPVGVDNLGSRMDIDSVQLPHLLVKIQPHEFYQCFHLDDHSNHRRPVINGVTMVETRSVWC